MRRTRREVAVCKPSTEASGDGQLADTLVSNFQPPGPWERKDLLFQLPRLWSCVPAGAAAGRALLQTHRPPVHSLGPA